MSLTRIALRLALCQTLRGKTEVGENVLDSNIGLVETDASGKVSSGSPKPFISIYTDRARAENVGSGLRSLVVNGATDISIDIGVSTQHVGADPLTDESVIMQGLPATDDAMEFYLDLVVRQIDDALLDPSDPWADLCRSFVIKTISVDRACATSGTGGIRVALHQSRMRVDLIVDPVRGKPLRADSTMARFFDLVRNLDHKQQVKAAKMLAQIEGTASSYEIAMRRYGYTTQEAEALLLAPFEGVIADAMISEVTSSPVEVTP